ncbi:hypothetical protein [Pyrobaculum sp.]|uniref:hypothetical protein n=1 Tax=Pyrobaculum sp. TaxID=2004705 RepID=UPI003D09BC32
MTYAKPLIYLSDYDTCLRCRDGIWACVFYDNKQNENALYEIRYFDDVRDIMRYLHPDADRIDIEPNLICATEYGEEYCYKDEL